MAVAIRFSRQGKKKSPFYRIVAADKTAARELDELVDGHPGLVLATQLRGSRQLRPETRTPFKEILRVAGRCLDLVVVIDEGRPEGMWRDPFGGLCDRLLSNRRDASAACAGYLLVRGGQALAHFRKALWDPLEDAEAITAYLARIVPGLSPWTRPKPMRASPSSSRRPKPKKTPLTNPAARAPGVHAGGRPASSASASGAGAGREEPSRADAWAVLGLGRGATFSEAKKAYRTLIQQHHPDKVAHLAPELRELAEQRTRELNGAMEQIAKKLTSRS